MLSFVVEEPGREVVFRIEGVAGETVVYELGEGLFAVNELSGEGDGFGCDESSVWRGEVEKRKVES